MHNTSRSMMSQGILLFSQLNFGMILISFPGAMHMNNIVALKKLLAYTVDKMPNSWSYLWKFWGHTVCIELL